MDLIFNSVYAIRPANMRTNGKKTAIVAEADPKIKNIMEINTKPITSSGMPADQRNWVINIDKTEIAYEIIHIGKATINAGNQKSKPTNNPKTLRKILSGSADGGASSEIFFSDNISDKCFMTVFLS